MEQRAPAVALAGVGEEFVGADLGGRVESDDPVAGVVRAALVGAGLDVGALESGRRDDAPKNSVPQPAMVSGVPSASRSSSDAREIGMADTDTGSASSSNAAS